MMMRAFNFSFTSSNLLYLSCILCLVSFHRAEKGFDFATRCVNNTITNTRYQENLNSLLSALSSNASRVANGFYNSTAGLQDDPGNAVYGLFLCRGDISSDDCQLCVANASQGVLQLCPNSTTAIVWYDTCLLRYSNEPIFSRLDYSHPDAYYSYWFFNETDFNPVLKKTLNEIAKKAADDRSGKHFAVLEASFSDNSLYALGQCTPDLSGADCQTCLSNGITVLPNCCRNRQGVRVLLPSCNIRYENWRFYDPSAQQDQSPPPGKGVSQRTIIAIIVPVVVSILLFVVASFFLIRRSRKRNVGSQILTPEALQYDLRSIQAATNNFSLDNKIGEGGFGHVYKGILPNGLEIAVKRLFRSSTQVLEEFKNEIILVANLQHRNLVRLLGFCFEGQEKILIYELVPNKSLDYFLFDPGRQHMLDWPRRYKIVQGIARGLLYLHEDSRPRIIHRDLKASNILLDEDLNPKIADFGTAKLFGPDQSTAATSRIAGTYGYMAPEYAFYGRFSVGSDAFSFGVLVLEIVTGKKISSFQQSDGDEYLLSYAWMQFRDGTPLTLLDPTIEDSSIKDHEVIKCIHIGLLCVQENVDQRPTMASVVLMLSSHSDTLPTPNRPPFYAPTTAHSSEPHLHLASSNSVTASTNEMTVTELHPR